MQLLELFLFFKTGSHSVVLGGLKLTIQIKLALNHLPLLPMGKGLRFEIRLPSQAHAPPIMVTAVFLDLLFQVVSYLR